MPDITRLFKGPKNEFEVEVVFAKAGENSPQESHSYEEIVLLLEGAVDIKLSGQDKARSLKPLDLLKISAGTEHKIFTKTPMKLLVIHPNRTT